MTRTWRDAPAAVAGGRLATWPAVAVAMAGGLALAAAFPPAGLWPLAAAGPALLAVALWRRGAGGSLLVGLAFGLAFFTPLLSWTLNVAWYAWAALIGLNLVVFAPLVLGQRLLLRLRAWPLAVAGWWVAAESLRDRWPFGGFPWGRLAMSQSAAPTARWVAIGGPSLLTFVVALTGACAAWLFLASGQPGGRQPRPRRLPRTALPAACLLGALFLALAAPLLPAGSVPRGSLSAEVAAVQGNVPRARSLPDLLREDTVTANHALATEQLAARAAAGRVPRPDLVIWPENSTDQDPDANPYVYATIAQALAAIGRPILVGAVLADPQRNTGQLWLPGRGPVQIYVKRKLVPFGETIPLRGFLELFSSLPKLQPVNFTPGHKPVVFRVGKIRLGDVICYEIGFDGLVSSEVAAGANLLAMQTNDADFEIDGQTGETGQQLAMARIRAIEHDRAVVVASTTGVSAIIAPDGRLIASTGTWQRAEITARVPLIASTTLADELGGWTEAVITGATLAALALALAGAIAGLPAQIGQASVRRPR